MKNHLFVLSFSLLLFGLTGICRSGVVKDEPRSDWSQWRGANRDAVALEQGLLQDWPDGGPEVIWRVETGPGYSSVTVSGGLLYTMWDVADRQYLVGLDADTGHERWRSMLGPGFSHHYGDGPRSTPVVDRGLVYAVGTQGVLIAADQETGQLHWRHDLVEEYGARLPSYGYSSSPLVLGNRLILEAGGLKGTFMAFDSRTGRLLWSSGNDRPAYSSPLRVAIEEVEQVVFWSGQGLHALAPDTGVELWSYDWKTTCPVTGDPLNTGTPIFLPPDRIFVAGGSGSTVIRVSRESGAFRAEKVWESDQMRSDVNTPLRLGNFIYGFDRGILQCLDAGTGETRWQARGFQRGSLIAADGHLIVLGERGNLALVEANPDRFVQKSNVQVLDGKCWTTPTVAAGRLYLRNFRELVSLNLSP